MGKIHTIKLGQLENYEFRDRNISKDNGYSYRYFGSTKKVGWWAKLRTSLGNGYNPNKYNYVQVVKYWGKNRYYVHDGNHRVCLLKEMYGDEYQISVKIRSLISIVPTIFISLIIIPIVIIKRKLYGL